ncbi:hypothetical protein Nepgr_032782 [Nepenthes gracilis]|uniref:SAM domain-containing protein n=1 Tax=Nepenthes gracilis TaxID=150966 RepID=A0AAD3TKM7_NEPGR|nr:hypothetical protein Nepgr_032782 [Nepenthes gracilis]
MYADRVEAAENRSIKERLNGNIAPYSVRRRTVTGKRQRQDDKWEHDLYDDDEPTSLPKLKLDARDLRLKLQKKSTQLGARSGIRDLREKLSGSMHSQPVNRDPSKPKVEPEASKPARKSVILEPPVAESKQIANTTVGKKTPQKADTVDRFLQSLGLEKYLITFQAEEVDMTALQHMTDGDLKAIGIPMGPRKKILLALDSRT